MKKSYNTWLAMLVMFQSPFLSAQFDISNFNLKPYVGASASYPFGKSIKDLQTIEDEWESSSTDESNFTGTMLPLMGVNGGIELAYAISDGLDVGIGLQWSRFGHRYREVYSFNDQAYQFDSEQKATSTYRFTAVQVPLVATWYFSENWQLAFGASMGWVKKGRSARHISKQEFNVIINGKKDEAESEPLLKEEFDLAPSLKETLPSAFVGLRFPLPKGFQGYLDVHATPNAYSDEGAVIHYISARLGVMYPIYF